MLSALRPPNPRPRRSGCVLLALALWCGGAPALPFDEADRAFEAGDYAVALELYDLALERQPELMHALLRSATLLSWENRLGEALSRFELALSLEPDSREAARGRARVLSWSNRLDEAARAYEAILSRDPDDAESRRGLARTLAWQGEYEASRRHWNRVLSGDGDDVEALVGTARTYAWSGELDRAREWYERALGVEPGNKDASIGLGYVEFWSGNLSAAASRAADLSRRHPGDKDAEEYASRVRRARAPWARAETERVDDSDENRLDTYRVRGGLLLRSGLGLGLGVARYEMEDPSGSASIDALESSLTLTPGRGQELTLRLGLDRREDTGGRSSSDALGGASYAWGLDRRVDVRLAAGREAIRYSPRLTDNGILVDDLAASVGARFGSRWRIDVAAGAAELSDDNDRSTLIAGFGFELPVSRPSLETGYRFRHLDYGRDLDSGYFDPQDFGAHLARLRASGDFGTSRHSYSVTVEGGVQSFTLGGVEVTDDTVLILSGTLGLTLGQRIGLELFAGTSDYAAQTASGFESDRVGLRFRFRGGR